MRGYRENNEEVDRREETVTTQRPGYSSTEEFSRDVGAERRLNLFQVTRLLATLLGTLQVVLGLRFVLKLMAADPSSGFAAFIYGLTGPFVQPFVGLTSTWWSGDSILEVTTLIAMVIYALFFWGVGRVIQIVVDRPTARMVTRSTRQQIWGDGGRGERTTHTSSSDYSDSND
jgi:uncharacterized membrane protein